MIPVAKGGASRHTVDVNGPPTPHLSLEECAPVLRGIGDPSRLAILSALRDGPLSVSELTAHLGLKQYQTSRHLGALRELNLVVSERQGRRVIYSLSPKLQLDEQGDATLELGCCRVQVD